MTIPGTAFPYQFPSLWVLGGAELRVVAGAGNPGFGTAWPKMLNNAWRDGKKNVTLQP